MKRTYEFTYGEDPTGRCVGCYFLKIDYENCPNAPFCQGHEKPIIDIKYVSIDELKEHIEIYKIIQERKNSQSISFEKVKEKLKV